MRIDLLKIVQVKETSVKYAALQSQIRMPKNIYDMIESVLELSSESVEYFGIINLNVKNKVNGIHILSKGTVDATLVHPREVFKAAFLNNASSIILFHNHPSGDPSPSKEDHEMTKRIVEAGKIMGINVIDHIVVGDGRYCSFKELGVL